MKNPFDRIGPNVTLKWSKIHRGFIPDKMEDRQFLKRCGWKYGMVFSDRETPGKFSLDYLQRVLSIAGHEITWGLVGYE